MSRNRLSLTSLVFLPPAAFLALPSVATAGPVRSYTYTCNLNGMPARLMTRVETIGGAGIVSGPTGMSVMGTGDVSYVYEGELVSRTAHYYFTGRDSFADFWEPASHERFRVQFVPRGTQMVMIINPGSQGASYHVCQMTR